jgi:hypothetical protein
VEIEKARQLLEAVILGMAHSLRNCSEEIVRRLDKYSNRKFRNLRNVFISVTGIERVIVPEAKPTDSPDILPAALLKVRVVEFTDHIADSNHTADSNNTAKNGHPAPDPLLLAVKAAINWSRKNNQPLRAAAEPLEEEDELDDLAEEEYLERRKYHDKIKTWDDLARGLGQPLGYQGEDGVNA